MLNLSDVNTFYGKVHVLKDISLFVQEGELVGLIGSNGAGKTTLLRTISGLVKPVSGQIFLNEREIHGLPCKKLVRMGVIHVPDSKSVFPRMTVQENLEMGAYTREDKEAVHRDLDGVYDLFPILLERKKQLAETMSGGQKQMLAVARGLMSRPKLLLFDEPSNGLAPLIFNEIFRAITEINNRGTTVLLVEQNTQAALSIADRAYVIETGQVVLSGSGEELLNNNQVKNIYLGIA